MTKFLCMLAIAVAVLSLFWLEGRLVCEYANNLYIQSFQERMETLTSLLTIFGGIATLLFLAWRSLTQARTEETQRRKVDYESLAVFCKLLSDEKEFRRIAGCTSLINLYSSTKDNSIKSTIRTCFTSFFTLNLPSSSYKKGQFAFDNNDAVIIQEKNKEYHTQIQKIIDFTFEDKLTTKSKSYFRSVIFISKDFSHRRIENFDFKQCIFICCNFSRTTFNSVEFDNTCFFGCDFVGVNLKGSNLSENSFLEDMTLGEFDILFNLMELVFWESPLWHYNLLSLGGKPSDREWDKCQLLYNVYNSNTVFPNDFNKTNPNLLLKNVSSETLLPK